MRVLAAYSLEQGFANFVELAAARFATGATQAQIAEEVRPLFAARKWDAYPSPRPLDFIFRAILQNHVGPHPFVEARRIWRTHRKVLLLEAVRVARREARKAVREQTRYKVTPAVPSPLNQLAHSVPRPAAAPPTLQLTARPVAAGSNASKTV